MPKETVEQKEIKPKEAEKPKETVKLKEDKNKKEVNKYEMPKIPKTLKMLFSFTILLAISIVGFFGLKAYHSIDVKLPTILSGVESKKIGFYTTNIVFNGKGIDKNQAEYLISTFEEDETKFKTIEKWLKEDAENLKKDSNYKSDRPIRLQKSGKILGLFDDYKIHLDPIKLKVEKDDEVQTTILLNGKEEAVSDKEYELFPGKYTIFYYDNNIKLKEDITLFYDEKSDIKTVSYGAGTEYQIANEVEKLDTNSNESSFKILTRDENSILFVNDKNTELTVKEFNKLSGTNIKQGDILKVVTKMPWGYTISDGVTYQGEKKINVSTSLTDKRLLEVAIARTIELLREDVQSRGKKDANLLTTMIDPSLRIEAKRVESLINNGREYVGGYPSMEFDLNSFEIREYGDTYEMYIGGHLLVQETTYPQNSKPPQLTSITPEEFTVGFHFIYDKEKKNWYSNIWGFTTRTITRTNIRSVDISKDMIAR
ncbi:conserved domain protein [Parvimonas sp. oral taxon 393 str. F0440]|nr:conserved domain protein [Parvimonas sp. oral taxon 393 str. F0440]